jgi:hypothetical protein
MSDLSKRLRGRQTKGTRAALQQRMAFHRPIFVMYGTYRIRDSLPPDCCRHLNRERESCRKLAVLGKDASCNRYGEQPLLLSDALFTYRVDFEKVQCHRSDYMDPWQRHRSPHM